MTCSSPALAAQLTPLTTPPPGASGIAVVAIRRTEHAITCHGRLDHQQPGRPVEPTTRFEIGSITKTFTALLLADLAERGLLNLDDPITRHLPPHWHPRRRGADTITLLQLATHTAGVPRIPANLIPVLLPRLNTNPYAAYTREHLRAVSRRINPRRAGTRVRYSNVGVGLLGHLLTTVTGQDYAHLITTRICAPLGLRDTSTEPPSTTDATGHRKALPRPPIQIPGIPGAGALRSSARDLARYLRALLDPNTTPLASALHAVQQPRINPPDTTDELALIWNLRRYPDHTLYFHGGATCGFTAFVGFCPQAHAGLAVLTNTANTRRSSIIPPAYDLLEALIN